jgi:hypothetical protein
VTKVSRSRHTVPGTNVTARAFAITAEVEESRGSQSQKVTPTFYEYKVKGDWKFVMTADRLNECR